MRTVWATLLQLALCYSLASAAINFDGTSNAAALGNTALDVTPPFTVCATVRPANTTADLTAFSIGRAANNSDVYSLRLRGNATGDPVTVTVGTTSLADVVDSTAAFAANTWQRVCGVWLSTTSRTVYLNGGNSATGTVSVSPAAIDLTGIGALHRLTDALFFNGDIANVGVWGVALDAGELAAYNAGYAAFCIHPSNMPGYYEMVTRDAGGVLPDVSGSTRTPLTLQSGTSTATDHPPIINCQ